ncbi:hypothetical protein L3Q82_022545, partial [Scortum barcoo]
MADRGSPQAAEGSDTSGDDEGLRTARTNLSHGIREAKNQYSRRIAHRFSDSRVVTLLFQELPSDFSSAFNTIIPQQLILKLDQLGINTSLCNWLLDFLSGRPQAVRVGRNTSSTTTLNTGAPQGCVLSPLLFTLLTHDCTSSHISNLLIKFADDTTMRQITEV